MIGFVVLAVRTITVPSIVGRVVPLTLTDGLWMRFFSPVFAYLLLAVSDTFGRFATMLYVFPSARRIWLLLFVGLYSLFLPAFLFCNVQPRSHLPVVFKYDAIFIVLVLVFAMMGGYLRTICSCHITQIMPVDKVHIAGEMVNLFSVYGSILGFLAFLFTAIV
ncbi:equilibrative nucleoside transporter 1-like [Erpetoichthys calabaricus]|uniref:equilibrative nucleoside transporter 1-like n=1 Tax=Erpetoichthys calabaricus TaxID=27687 RepID=UPI002233F07D|nr:equilibrative nucleoside transporter 1-like [Erpetoichthys calabaricus]